MATNITEVDPLSKYAEVLGMDNLTALAEDNHGALAVGIMDIIWILWIAASMLIPWQNS
jgi:hypothetical protein